MPIPRPTSKNTTKRPAGILGVHPLLAAAAALALVFAGVMFGAWLNVASKTAAPLKPVAAPAPKPSRNAPLPAMPNLDQVAGAPRSMFDQTAAVAPPAEAEAEDDEPAPQSVPPMASPLELYAVPSQAPAHMPVVAIVIDDMGLDRARGQKALDLPAPLTLSFLTYASDLQSWVAKARAAGHEVMAHVPMEPTNTKENPGPKALLTSQSPAQAALRLSELLDPWSGYIGINNHMGSKFTADTAHMSAVIDVLKSRGLLWLDSKTTGSSAGGELARKAGVPTVERDVFLDNVQTREAVREELSKVEQLAKQRGSAIAIGHPHEVTMTELRVWLDQLTARGLALAPLSEVARRQGQIKSGS